MTSSNLKVKSCADSTRWPLPVPVMSYTGLPPSVGNWSHYKGLLINGIVIIEDPAHAEALWNNGFFGLGHLSSSGMNHKANSDIINETRYERKLRWQSMQENDNTLSKPSTSSQQDTEASPLQNQLSDTIFCVKKDENNQPAVEEFVDPFPINEHLTLTLEEALYLSYALGALVVTSEEGTQMDIDAMWRRFKQLQPTFPLQYAVYHHFRCKGWVVKPGMKYGSDWLLYKLGPTYYHAEFMVWTTCLWKDILEVDCSLSTRKDSVVDISAVERLASHVAKKVLLCYVARPRSLTDECLNDISCLKHFEITQAILQRWSPSMEENQKKEPTKKS